MKENEFWKYIEKSRGNPEKLANLLSELSCNELKDFNDIFGRLCAKLSPKVEKILIKDRGYRGDFIDYTVYGAIALGKEAYYDILKDPKKILDVQEKEDIAYVAEDVAEMKKCKWVIEQYSR